MGKTTRSVEEIQVSNVLRAEAIEGKIVRITNGVGNNKERGTVSDGSADRAFAGTSLPNDVVRLDIKVGQEVFTNVRTSGSALTKAAKRGKVNQLIGCTFNGAVVRLKKGELAVIKDGAKLVAIELENDRNQLTGEYYLSPGLNEAIATAVAGATASALQLI